MMIRIVLLLALATGLAACSIVDTLIDGWKHAKAVEADLEKSTGTRPGVGFDWHNGWLTRVTVTFPGLYGKKALPELASLVRKAVTDEFRQTPRTIVLGFALSDSDANTATLRDRATLAGLAP